MPISVSAGLVSALSSLLTKNISAESLSQNQNIGNMALLVAAATPLGDEYNHIPVVEENALVSEAGPAGLASDPSRQKPTSDQISVYIVREGDTLSQIAEMFNVTVNTIKWGNDLSSADQLTVGETLVILPISGVRYTVLKGDTLASIAKEYKGDIDEIAAYNGISSGKSLTVGLEIIIPDGEVQSSFSPHPSSSVVLAGSSSQVEYVGYYLRPVVGGVKTQGLHGHNAIDIAAPVGTPILAAADGQVLISRSGGWNGGYGNYVVIKHSNGTQTLYAHNNINKVSAGEYVKQGDVIATIGTTGKVTGPHLHFEVRGARNPF